ncbi:MAG TPA: GIY-YIG nuclease family protein [Flavobacteriales bacterium]|nr:GIY-YIG nuclease family protein [Flavobacteriales bacterium]HOP44910.1 GIY-YIG nuclease family protein [Flavobacteriales bacterium]
MYYVYILHCADGSYYTGVTNDVELRVAQHQAGEDPKAYTYKRRPLRLAYTEYHTDILQAIAREKQIKRWSKAKKEALIAGKESELVRLAKRRGGR